MFRFLAHFARFKRPDASLFLVAALLALWALALWALPLWALPLSGRALWPDAPGMVHLSDSRKGE